MDLGPIPICHVLVRPLDLGHNPFTPAAQPDLPDSPAAWRVAGQPAMVDSVGKTLGADCACQSLNPVVSARLSVVDLVPPLLPRARFDTRHGRGARDHGGLPEPL